jgi:ferredoxin-type protein NapH
MAYRIRQPKRQSTRRALLLVALLLFPITMNFLSPYVIIDGAFQGIVTGSFVVFGFMFAAALFVGRLWCAWLCPAAGLAEACFMINDRPARGGKLNWIKWGIWVPWIGLIAFAAVSAGGFTRVDLLHLTESGISVDAPFKYIVYYFVTGTIFVLSLAAGKRAFCHYGCWMAPFMILGRRVRNALNTPALSLAVETDRCISCYKCDRACPMSLKVQALVQSGELETGECILCGSCVDVCPKDVIRYSFSSTPRRALDVAEPSPDLINTGG